MLTPPPSSAEARAVSRPIWRLFWAWTAFFWGGTGVLAALFYVGVIDFANSAKIGLYGTSIWLNAWLFPLVLPSSRQRPLAERWHDAIVIWIICYTMTNALWEIPWVLSSPFIFDDLHTLDDIVARTDWMRESPLHMGWWVMASFGAVDLRTVNHDGTFYALEFFAFFNVASAWVFYRLNRVRSPLRYLVVVLGCGEPIAATFIFSMSEVFDGFASMSGGLADTLLALLWTQYQYFVFPIVVGWMGTRLLFADLHRGWTGVAAESA